MQCDFGVTCNVISSQRWLAGFEARRHEFAVQLTPDSTDRDEMNERNKSLYCLGSGELVEWWVIGLGRIDFDNLHNE